MTKMVAVVIAGWMALGAAQMEAASGTCASTPAGALRAAKGELITPDAAASTLPAEARGYRVEAVRWDPFLRQAWAVVRSCEHLEQPSFLVRTEMASTSGSSGKLAAAAAGRLQPALPIVRAGDLVRLWSSEGHAHIELMATSEDNGAVGARVRLRLAMARDMDGQAVPPQYLAGVVRGPADVEMAR